MEHPKSEKWAEDENGILERRETVTVQTAARGVTSTPNRPASGSGGKMAIKFLQYENEDEKENEEEEEEEELEDVQDTLKASCGASPKCAELLEVLNECNDRVNSRAKTMETCEQELFDFVSCVNACVVKELFNRLK